MNPSLKDLVEHFAKTVDAVVVLHAVDSADEGPDGQTQDWVVGVYTDIRKLADAYVATKVDDYIEVYFELTNLNVVPNKIVRSMPVKESDALKPTEAHQEKSDENCDDCPW